MINCIRVLPWLLIVIIGWVETCLASGMTLTEQARPLAVIVLPDEASETERLAAEEIRSHVKLISGAELAVVQSADALAGRRPLFIGKAADAKLHDALREKASDPASFLLRVTDSRADLAGSTDEGTLFAAYELLEQLGVRWFHPGEMGTVIPREHTLAIPVQEKMHSPSFIARNVSSIPKEYPQWYKRMRMGGPWFGGGHGIPPFKNARVAKAYYESNPEYFALVNGKRVNHQICVSNPEVIRLAIEAAKDHFKRNPDLPWIGMAPTMAAAFANVNHAEIWTAETGMHSPTSPQ